MHNKQLIIQILSLMTLMLSNIVFGQEKKSEQELERFMIQLKSSKVDNFLILKSGCFGCEVQYIDTSKFINDGQTIYVLTQNGAQYDISIFDDLNPQKHFKIDTCSLFTYIDANKITLLKKETFYKKETPKLKSKNGFIRPHKVHYSYENLNINLPNFIYTFEINDSSNDQFGIKREKEEWFKLTKEIINRVYNYSLLVKD
jgi:hypothetical protein